MNFLAVAALALAGLSTILLIVVFVQLRALGATVTRLATSNRELASRARKDEPLLQMIASELKAIENQIGGFDIVFSEVQRQLNMMEQAAARTGLASGAARQAPLAPAPATTAPSTASPPSQKIGESDHVAARATPQHDDTPLPHPAPMLRADPAVPSAIPANIADLQPLLAEYRELIAQPRKNEINRWSDDLGGWACEVGEDGTLHPIGRDAGGLLVLVTRDDLVGALLPGGRLVVDFPTSFANVMSMRRVTRQSFDLTNDGSGLLRLIEPAWAERVGDKWQVVRAGKLAGLSSD